MQEVHVVGAAIIQDGKVLAAQRSEKMNEPLKWEFAGGKVESGETHQKALQRELREELGVSVEVRNFVASGISEVGIKRIILHVYEAIITDGIARASEHAQLKWIDIENIMSLDWAKADIPACQKILKMYQMNNI